MINIFFPNEGDRNVNASTFKETLERHGAGKVQKLCHILSEDLKFGDCST